MKTVQCLLVLALVLLTSCGESQSDRMEEGLAKNT